MTARLRIAGVIVTPVLLWDDGENLTPGPQAQPQQVALADLDGMADRLRAEVEQHNAQADAPPVPMPTWDRNGPTGDTTH